ncbi:unnamed protein product, partial [Polarella glacialis]
DGGRSFRERLRRNFGAERAAGRRRSAFVSPEASEHWRPSQGREHRGRSSDSAGSRSSRPRSEDAAADLKDSCWSFCSAERRERHGLQRDDWQGWTGPEDPLPKNPQPSWRPEDPMNHEKEQLNENGEAPDDDEADCQDVSDTGLALQCVNLTKQCSKGHHADALRAMCPRSCGVCKSFKKPSCKWHTHTHA